jgi:L-lactate dehydrogenase (cytochrome)
MFVKALCLGAKAVGLGRPFLYSLVLGKAGVSRAIRVLKQEIEMTMPLLGVERVEQLGMEYVEVVDGLSRFMVGDLKPHL